MHEHGLKLDHLTEYTAYPVHMERLNWLVKTIQHERPSKGETVRILDVGCGTGCMVDVLREAGSRAFGVDKSQAMVEFSKQKYPQCQI